MVAILTGLRPGNGTKSDREIFAGWLGQPVKLGYILQSDTIDQIEFRGALCDTMCRVGAEIPTLCICSSLDSLANT